MRVGNIKSGTFNVYYLPNYTVQVSKIIDSELYMICIDRHVVSTACPYNKAKRILDACSDINLFSSIYKLIGLVSNDILILIIQDKGDVMNA